MATFGRIGAGFAVCVAALGAVQAQAADDLPASALNLSIEAQFARDGAALIQADLVLPSLSELTRPFAEAAFRRLPAAERERRDRAMLDRRAALVAAAWKALETRLADVWGRDVEIVQRPQYLSTFTARVSPLGLARLEKNVPIRNIRPMPYFKAAADLPWSIPWLGAPRLFAKGVEGEDQTVAVLDTGIIFRVAGGEFGPCTSDPTSDPQVARNADPTQCSVILARNFAGADADDPNYHGNNVSGIVHFVAPKARILSLDVFQYFSQGGAGGYFAPGNALQGALEFVAAQQSVLNIRSINMSLGGGSDVQGFCTESLGDFTGALLDRGAVFAIASGNDNTKTGIGWPACGYPAMSVGAMLLNNQTGTPEAVEFSNANNVLTILAPGVRITAGGVPNASGTSMAAPHVAGAVAVYADWIRQRTGLPASGRAIVNQMLLDAVPVTDPRFPSKEAPDPAWRFGALRFGGEFPDEEIQLVEWDRPVTLAPNQSTPFTFRLPGGPGKANLDDILIGVTIEGNTPTETEIVLVAPDGTTSVSARPETNGMGRGMAQIVGRTLAPRFFDPLINFPAAGEWTIAIRHGPGRPDAIKLYNLFVAVHYRNTAEPVVPAALAVADGGLDFARRTVGYTFTTESPHRRPVSCRRTVTVTSAGGSASAVDDIQVTTGFAEATGSAPMPPNVDGTLTIEAVFDCGEFAVEPARITAVRAVSFAPVAWSRFRLDRAIVRSTPGTLAWSFEAANPNPWAVGCTIEVDPGNGTPVPTGASIRASGTFNVQGTTPLGGFENGASRTATAVVTCPSHGVSGSPATASYRMVDPATVTIRAEPPGGPAPLTVRFTADIRGAADRIRWDFGDFASGEGGSVEHTYTAPGNYTALVVVTNAAGEARAELPVAVGGTGGDTDGDTGSGAGAVKGGGGCAGAGGVSAVWAGLAAVLLRGRRRRRWA